MNSSTLQNIRYAYQPKLPSVFRGTKKRISARLGSVAEPDSDKEKLASMFPATYGLPFATFVSCDTDNTSLNRPLKVGVILSGGPAPGGHNVIAGLFDGLLAGNSASRLYGFRGGPGGLVEDKCMDLTAEVVDRFRNTGGFDLVGSGRTKIETPEQFDKAYQTAMRRELDALVVVGGDDSNTNAALLAEYFAARKAPVSVVGVPKTIDGDLKSELIETSFGFDTAAKLYSELVGNIEKDSASGRKYWHFIKLMGRSASHIALEVALQCHPNVALISEEVEARKMSLDAIVAQIAASVAGRAAHGENFGVVLIPEGLIEFVPEFKVLIAELNDVMANKAGAFKALPDTTSQREFVRTNLSADSSDVYSSLPAEIQIQLFWDRDPHGNVQVSRIETEKLLAAMVRIRMAEMAKAGTYAEKFDWQNHFFGYEGRCAFPSNFDADYCYSLGYTAFALAANGLSGYLSSVRNLTAPATEWTSGGVPLVSLMNMERRHGEDKPVIRKALVELDGRPFLEFSAHRDVWALSSDYRIPGGIQYFGPAVLTDCPTMTLALERGATIV